MFTNMALSVKWVLLIAIPVLLAVFAMSSSSVGNGGQPFPPGSRVEGYHPDALLILHNLGAGASLRVNSEGGGPGLRADSKAGDGIAASTADGTKSGVWGYSTVGIGIKGQSDNNDGVVGVTKSKNKSGVWGHSTVGVGVIGDSDNNHGVIGRTSRKDKSGVRGWSAVGVGITGQSDNNDGVVGITGAPGKSGVWGRSTTGVGVSGSSTSNDGVVGWTESAAKSGVFGWSINGIGVTARSDKGTALYVDGTSIFKKFASFEGGHGDLAENYYGSAGLEGGDVVVIDPGSGMTLKLASRANDTAVAGIVSTAPAMRLQGQIADDLGVPLVIAGRTLCKVDAGYGSIKPGDLLTTSPTPGYAMKAQPIIVGGVELYRPGTIIGKALEAWDEGRGTIMVLVALH